ncbi:MAG: hypothetical protein NT056_10865, partial [Proteobacteria bacterium]|nr:hypothetical protein [Pseudomonadota bacterium]
KRQIYMSKSKLIFGLVLLVLLAGCGGGGTKDYGPIENYADLYKGISQYLTGQVICAGCSDYQSGDIIPDEGDSNAYYPALVYSLSLEGLASEPELAVAAEMVAREITLINGLSESGIISSLDDATKLSEVYIGIAGLLKAYEATRRPEYLEAIRKYFAVFSPLVTESSSILKMDSLMSINIPWYGPTTIFGGLAGFFLQYPLSVPKAEDRAGITDTGIAIISKLDDLVYDPARENYRYMIDSEDFLYLYSSVCTVQGLLRAHLVTKASAYLDQAKGVMESMESLFNEESGGYLAAEYDSRYFAAYEKLGQTRYFQKYIPLSGANYLTYTDLLLYQITGEEIYLTRAARILDFIQKKLYVNGQVHHHLLNGVLETGEYCAGCNFQLLYNIYLYDRLKKGGKIL